MSQGAEWKVPKETPLPEALVGFDPASVVPDERFSAYQRHLPHWRVTGACYASTLRLNDSLPSAVVAQMRRQAEEWRVRLIKAAALCHGKVPPEVAAEWAEFQRSQLRKLDQVLDAGHGSCLLKASQARKSVATTLFYFEGQRCEVFAYAVMPNHAHILFRPLESHTVEKLTGSWKANSTRQINRLLGRRGSLWQQETFDRVIRDAAHYRQAVRYMANNPVKARLSNDHATVWFCGAIQEANGWKDRSAKDP